MLVIWEFNEFFEILSKLSWFFFFLRSKGGGLLFFFQIIVGSLGEGWGGEGVFVSVVIL